MIEEAGWTIFGCVLVLGCVFLVANHQNKQTEKEIAYTEAGYVQEYVPYNSTRVWTKK